LLAAWEWSFLAGLKKFSHCIIYPAIILFIMIGCLMLPISYILYIASFSWVIALVLIVIYPKGKTIWGNSILLRGMMGILVLIPCWVALNFIHTPLNGPLILLFLIALICVADTVAYFTGKKWGKHKLLPQVSPGKTWEGLIGALLVTSILVLGLFQYAKVPQQQWLLSISLCLVTVLFSVVGDLFESMLKRNAEVKDSGKLLPGHGGILDRIDSLTAAAPIFALGALWLGEWFK
jgi:phosphatidate cytidylyltransferase